MICRCFTFNLGFSHSKLRVVTTNMGPLSGVVGIVTVILHTGHQDLFYLQTNAALVVLGSHKLHFQSPRFVRRLQCQDQETIHIFESSSDQPGLDRAATPSCLYQMMDNELISTCRPPFLHPRQTVFKHSDWMVITVPLVFHQFVAQSTILTLACLTMLITITAIVKVKLSASILYLLLGAWFNRQSSEG